MHDLMRKHAGVGAGTVRAALPTHILETGAVALGVLNYANEATEIGAEGDEHMTEPRMSRKSLVPSIIGHLETLLCHSGGFQCLRTPPPKRQSTCVNLRLPGFLDTT